MLVALFVSLIAARADPPVPPLTGRVMDLAEILDQAEKDRITAELANFEKQKQLQLVVVTLPDLAGYTIEDWGLALGRSWGIGQKGKDNGVILLVAPKDHELRIEVGYGLEGDLPDATANEIIRKDITPHFRKGEMALGIEAGVQAIIKTLGGTVDASVAVPAAGRSSPEDDGLLFWVSLIVFFGFVIFRNFGGRRRGFLGGYYAAAASGAVAAGVVDPRAVDPRVAASRAAAALSGAAAPRDGGEHAQAFRERTSRRRSGHRRKRRRGRARNSSPSSPAGPTAITW